jgi:hypothetical protein
MREKSLYRLQGQLQNRYWEVLVTQLSCEDVTLAPSQCLQYFAGITGTIESFNWQNIEAPFHLSDQVVKKYFKITFSIFGQFYELKITF